jgi:hypothetical protein
METPNAFSIRKAIAGDGTAFSLAGSESAAPRSRRAASRGSACGQAALREGRAGVGGDAGRGVSGVTLVGPWLARRMALTSARKTITAESAPEKREGSLNASQLGAEWGGSSRRPASST